MGEHNGHRERVRARYLKEGLSGFEPHTALEFLLFYARPRCDTNGLARSLLRRFGGFAQVMDAPIEELAAVEGMGYSSAVLLKMIPDFGAYYLHSRASPGDVVNSTEKAGAYFLPKFIGKTKETLYMAALDDRRKVLRCTCIAKEGSIDALPVSVKRVVAEALNAGATAVILAHNHPAGLALPSAGDKATTKQIAAALHPVNIRLLDHIIVADSDFVSMAESGLLDEAEF